MHTYPQCNNVCREVNEGLEDRAALCLTLFCGWLGDFEHGGKMQYIGFNCAHVPFVDTQMKPTKKSKRLPHACSCFLRRGDKQAAHVPTAGTHGALKRWLTAQYKVQRKVREHHRKLRKEGKDVDRYACVSFSFLIAQDLRRVEAQEGPWCAKPAPIQGGAAQVGGGHT